MLTYNFPEIAAHYEESVFMICTDVRPVSQNTSTFVPKSDAKHRLAMHSRDDIEAWDTQDYT